jgi:hypothetical protein
LPLVVVSTNGLAVEDFSIIEIALISATGTRASNVSIVSVPLASVFVVKDLLALVEEAGWAHIFELILFSVVVFEVPLGLVKLVSMNKVEDVSFIVDGKHCIGIQVDDVEAWGLVLIGSD